MDCEEETKNVFILQRQFAKELASFKKAIKDDQIFSIAKVLHLQTLSTFQELKAVLQKEVDCLDDAKNSFKRNL